MTSRTEQFYIQRIATLEKQVAELTATVAKLLKVNAELTDKIAHISKNVLPAILQTRWKKAETLSSILH